LNDFNENIFLKIVVIYFLKLKIYELTDPILKMAHK